jgi:hypothetical protein
MKKFLLGLVVLGASCALLVGVAFVGPSSLPAGKDDYVGTWLGDGVMLTITPQAKVRYLRQGATVAAGGAAASGSVTTAKSIKNLPITRMDSNGFVVGRLLISTRFVVNHPPAQVDGAWKMTVDGQELTRNVQADDESPTHVGVSCKGATGAVVCTASQRGVRESFKACFDLSIGCEGGTTVSTHACASSSPRGSTPEKVPLAQFKGFDRCEHPTGISLTKLTVDGDR